jgi:ribosomal protein L37AE/L43A
MGYIKAIIKAIQQENERQQLEPKCYVCGSKKELSLVCAPGIYYECSDCKKKMETIKP